VASAHVAGRLGQDTPDIRLVEFNGRKGTLQRWIENNQAALLEDLRRNEPDMYLAVVKSPGYRRLRADSDAYDYVVNNWDRKTDSIRVEVATDQATGNRRFRR
jgi:hypothetical protein